MPSFTHGIGFSGSRRSTFAAALPLPAALRPSAQWNGTAGSGFTATPTDPTRTTAKPCCRLLVPSHQFFTDRLVVGVASYALNGSTLVNGVERVRFHYEGGVAEVTQPSYRSFSRYDGSNYQCFGYWVELVHTGTSGNCDLYVEAVPTDATMQNRVIGPFKFFPQRYDDGAGGFTPYDFRVEVNSTKTAVTGSIYNTFASAAGYLRTQAARNPLITFTHGAGNITPDPTTDYTPDGYLNITATVPVTFGRASFATRGDLRPRWPTHLIGTNITLDIAHTGQVTAPAVGRAHWADHIHISNSLGRDSYWQEGALRPLSFIFGGTTWFTDCLVTDTYEPFASADLVRGCVADRISGDCYRFTRMAANNIVSEVDSTFFNTAIPSLVVEYSGAATTATITGTGSTGSKTLTLRENGNSIGTFTATVSGAAYIAGTNYFIQNVADWINTFSGWSATVLSNERVAGSLATLGARGQAFAEANVKGSPLTLVAQFDIHNDVYAGNGENRVFIDNICTESSGQNIIIGGGACNDMFFVNSAFGNKEVGGWQVALTQQASAISSHVVWAHLTMPSQRASIRANSTSNAYCAVLCSTFTGLARENAGDPTIMRGNHTQDGSFAPSAATEHTIGGTRASLFADALGGSFVASGDLLNNVKARAATHDLNGQLRGANAPPGAVA